MCKVSLAVPIEAKAIEHILHNFPSLVAHLEHMAVGVGNSDEEKSRARRFLSHRFIFGSCYA